VISALCTLLAGQVHAAPGLDLSGAERLYNPYEGISSAIDGRGGLQRSVYKLPKQPEFLFSEEAAVHKRSWSENMTYYTGLGYFSGAWQRFHCATCGWSAYGV
jgi:import inner membrane translocase subunit TIM23